MLGQLENELLPRTNNGECAISVAARKYQKVLYRSGKAKNDLYRRPKSETEIRKQNYDLLNHPKIGFVVCRRISSH